MSNCRSIHSPLETSDQICLPASVIITKGLSNYGEGEGGEGGLPKEDLFEQGKKKKKAFQRSIDENGEAS